MAISLPVLLNDGSSLLIDGDFEDRLHNGDATIGWSGDERMGLYFSNGCVELRRLCEDGELRVIARSKPGVRFIGTDLLRQLAEHDSQSRRAYDAHEDIVSYNTAVMAARQAVADDHMGEAVQKLKHALRKDVGAYEGGSTRQYLPLAPAPWKKDEEL